jgi:GNAT superfamily N-acetyltransferase
MSQHHAVENPIRAAVQGIAPPAGIRIRDATEEDLPALAALREAVGWRVHDWAIRDLLAADTARLFVAESDGAVVASGSGIAYGQLGLVGNMVVAPDHRRRGLGRALLDATLDFLDGEGVRQAELYATPEGRLLYASAGFAQAGTNLAAQILRTSVPPPPAGIAVDGGTLRDLPALAAYDAPRFAGDRSPLLARALEDPARTVLLARRDTELVGWAMVPPEPGRIGPWLADALDSAHALLAAALARSSEPLLRTGMPIENEEGAGWLRGLGAETHRWDGRMRLGSGVRQDYSRIFGIMVGALG